MSADHSSHRSPAQRSSETALCSGRQIRAARAMLGWTRADLAKAAGVHVNAVAYWERAPRIPALLPSGRQNLHETEGVSRLRKALEACGIRFITVPAPGIALCLGDNFWTSTRARA